MSGAEPRLKAGLWVKMALRMGDQAARPGVVVRRGDPDAGSVLVVLRGRDGLCVLSQTRTPDGERAWMRANGPTPVAQADIDAYVERQLRYDPDLWTDEAAFLARPGQDRIQLDLFYDYRTNPASYPAWQAWLHDRQPPTLVLWGRYDPSFAVSEVDAFRRDLPNAECHILDAGHFALDEAVVQSAALIRSFITAAPT